MEYELINPSDPYTFIASSNEVAALTVFCLSTSYGAKAKDGSFEVPITMFGGGSAWYEEQFGHLPDDGLSENKEELANALESMMYGGFEDRKRYQSALKAIDDDKKREEFIAEWQDGRSSLNDIGNYAHALAKKLKGEHMKLSEELKRCLDGSGCGNCEHHEADTKFICRGLLQKAYERIKGYEDMFPCEVGDKLYYPIKTQNRIAEFEITEIQIFKDEMVFFDDSDNLYHAEDFGKEVFLTREQAEAELKKNEEVEE